MFDTLSSSCKILRRRPATFDSHIYSCIYFVFFSHLTDHLNFIYMSRRCSLYLTNLWHIVWLIFILFCRLFTSLIFFSSKLSSHSQAMIWHFNDHFDDHHYPGIGKPMQYVSIIVHLIGERVLAIKTLRDCEWKTKKCGA